MPTANEMSQILVASIILIDAVYAAYPEADDELVKLICTNAVALSIADRTINRMIEGKAND